MVGRCVYVFRVKQFHETSPEVCIELPVIIVEGTLKQEIQVPRKVCETGSAVLSAIAGQCVNLSMQVKM